MEKRLKKNKKRQELRGKELKSLSPRILSNREEEKKYLSNILHGEVGAVAVALNSCLDRIEESIKSNNLRVALEACTRTKSELDEFVSRLKKIAVDLRRPDLGAMGLAASLREYFSDIKKYTDIKINFKADIDEKRIDDKMAIVLYGVIQEALNNIIKHARANRVEVNIFSLAKRIKLSISDDGKGFNVEKCNKGTDIHLGLGGMKEVTESIKGTFNIKSIRGKGTKISVIIPLS